MPEMCQLPFRVKKLTFQPRLAETWPPYPLYSKISEASVEHCFLPFAGDSTFITFLDLALWSTQHLSLFHR